MASSEEYNKNEPLIIESSDDTIKAVIARGKAPVQGSGYKIVYCFNPDRDKPKPRISEDGRVNYHDLGVMKLCKAGDVLAYIQSGAGEDEGEFGFTVGRFSHEGARMALMRMRGDNTVVSSGGASLIAAADGTVVLESGRVSVSRSLVINSDINISTGDVIFPGMVHVAGDIRNGYMVKAGAGISVSGVVEAARLEANGDIILENGVRGANGAVLSAGGGVRANFLEGCAVSAKGDITAGSILHCQVTCGGALTLEGKRGVLVGGKAVVKLRVTAAVIGSPTSAPTELYVGYEPDTMLLYQRLRDEYAETAKRYNEANRSINTLRARGSLGEDEKRRLIKTLHDESMLREKLKGLRGEFDNILPGMDSRDGFIRAGLIYYGVRAQIGNAVIYIKANLTNSVLTNMNGKINIGVS